MTSKKQNILLKISGESLSRKDEIFSDDNLNELSNQVKLIKAKYNIGIVIGGGNIIRGARKTSVVVDRVSKDQMGMLATIINSIALRDALIKKGLKVKLYSLILAPSIANIYNPLEACKDLDDGYVVIFAGGTGNPYFSTDTGIALRVLETSCKLVLMGKNGVDGIYTSDPHMNKTAKRINKLTYKQAIEQKIEVMDLTALSLLANSDIKILVFDANQKQSFVNALNKKIKYSEVTR